jgi:hypothetical protein
MVYLLIHILGGKKQSKNGNGCLFGLIDWDLSTAGKPRFSSLSYENYYPEQSTNDQNSIKKTLNGKLRKI